MENPDGKTPVTNTFTAIIKQENNWWIGWVEEIPGVNCQEKTYNELIESLRVTIGEALEFNRKEALDIAGSGYREEKIQISA
jgi:predicted RNase H-like HicB family nuclease